MGLRCLGLFRCFLVQLIRLMLCSDAETVLLPRTCCKADRKCIDVPALGQLLPAA